MAISSATLIILSSILILFLLIYTSMFVLYLYIKYYYDTNIISNFYNLQLSLNIFDFDECADTKIVQQLKQNHSYIRKSLVEINLDINLFHLYFKNSQFIKALRMLKICIKNLKILKANNDHNISIYHVVKNDEINNYYADYSKLSSSLYELNNDNDINLADKNIYLNQDTFYEIILDNDNTKSDECIENLLNYVNFIQSKYELTKIYNLFHSSLSVAINNDYKVSDNDLDSKQLKKKIITCQVALEQIKQCLDDNNITDLFNKFIGISSYINEIINNNKYIDLTTEFISKHMKQFVKVIQELEIKIKQFKPKLLMIHNNHQKYVDTSRMIVNCQTYLNDSLDEIVHFNTAYSEQGVYQRHEVFERITNVIDKLVKFSANATKLFDNMNDLFEEYIRIAQIIGQCNLSLSQIRKTYKPLSSQTDYLTLAINNLEQDINVVVNSITVENYDENVTDAYIQLIEFNNWIMMYLEYIPNYEKIFSLIQLLQLYFNRYTNTELEDQNVKRCLEYIKNGDTIKFLDTSIEILRKIN